MISLLPFLDNNLTQMCLWLCKLSLFDSASPSTIPGCLKPIQTVLKYQQGWGISRFSRQPAPKGIYLLKQPVQFHDSLWNSTEQFRSVSRSRLIVLWEGTFYLAFNFFTDVLHICPVLVFWFFHPSKRDVILLFTSTTALLWASSLPPKAEHQAALVCFAMQVESQWPWMIHSLDKPPEDCIISEAKLPVRYCNTWHRCLFLADTSLGKSVPLFFTSIT